MILCLAARTGSGMMDNTIALENKNWNKMDV